MRRLAAAVALVLLTGCGLPLTEGVRSAGEVPVEQTEPAGIQVLPPGPQPGATATELVRGFLRAQSSPDDAHAVARQFLAPDTVWDDTQFAVVYTPGSQTVRVDPTDPERVEVRLQATARIASDGSYRLAAEGQQMPAEQFRVQRNRDGELELTDVPAGLRLTTVDVSRSYVPRDVYQLGRPVQADDPVGLVPDRVFLPVTSDPAAMLVASLLAGASQPLAPAVETAVPPDTALASPVVVEDGVVTVDLTAPVRDLAPLDRQRLSAQLVWTLQDFTGVRLLVEGEPLQVSGAGQVQTRDDWAGYDPAGALDNAALYYVQGRKLQSLDGALAAGAATRPGPLQVDEAAVNPISRSLAVLTGAPGVDEIRIGSLRGTMGEPVFSRPDLASMSWGSGERGLWVLERGEQPRVWVLSADGSPEQEVLIERPDGAGPLSRVVVSRDGARVALVFGLDDARELFVGRVQPAGSGMRVADVVPVAPAFRDVTDVSWESGTSLVVLAADSSAAGLLALRVSVDGSINAPLQRQGVEGVPISVAAAPGQELVVAAAQPGLPSRLFRDNGVLFRPQVQGSAPFYPG